MAHSTGSFKSEAAVEHTVVYQGLNNTCLIRQRLPHHANYLSCAHAMGSATQQVEATQHQELDTHVHQQTHLPTQQMQALAQIAMQDNYAAAICLFSQPQC